MNFKSLYCVSVLFLGVCFMTSCDDETIDGNGDFNGGSSYYWDRSDAYKSQLKGNVKTVIVDDSAEIHIYNRSGVLLTSTTKGEYGYEIVVHERSNGQLIRTISNWYSNNQSNEDFSADTVTFSFNTSGKYVPRYPDGLDHENLIKNLSTFGGDWHTTRFVTSGDSMFMLREYHNMQDITSYTVDTMCSIRFVGALPVVFTSRHGVTTVTYAEDGRYITIDEIYPYSESRTITRFKEESDYLLMTAMEFYYDGEALPRRTVLCTYNENDDLIGQETSNFEEEYFDYEYDDKNNWINRTYRYKYDYEEDWTVETQTRTITYWE